MKWRKRFANMIVVNGWMFIILLFMIGGVVYQHAILDLRQDKIDKLSIEVEAAQERVDNLNNELKDSRKQVEEVEADLERFVDKIEYGSDPAPTYDIPLSEDLQQFTYDTCRYYGIEEHYETVLAMMWRESTFESTRISVTNDYGLLQINICNHKYLKETLGLVDMLDEKDNIEGGVYLLSTLLSDYDSVEEALMVYNMGPGGAALQWERGNYTSAYVKDVLTKTEAIKENRYI